MKDVRIGVIGFGRQGEMYSKNIKFMTPNAKLVCIAELNIDAIKKNDFDNVDIYKDYLEIIKRKDIDAIVIATGADSHERIIIDACKAGKHIFCEKPVALNIRSIEKIEEEIDRAGIKFMVGFNRRFDPNFSKIKELIEKGKIGNPNIITITSRDPKPPTIEYLKNSGGIFMDQTIHDFDMIRFLMGNEVKEIFAMGSVLVDPKIGELEDVDTTMIVLKFKNNAIGSINNSRKAVYGYDQRVEVFGSGGLLMAHNKTPNSVELFDLDGIHSDKPLFFNIERYPESFKNEITSFVETIRNDKTPEVTIIDGKISVLMALAAKESLIKNKPIKMEI